MIKEFIKYISSDPIFQSVSINLGIASEATSILSFGHQLYFSSSVLLTEKQIKALLTKINTEQNEHLKVIVKNEVGQRLDT